ncbi:hypothetical protein HanPSC8_Chr12g0521621 [Helianthus annuus]|nr:hypothetical protein HanPSC8_Chr12g0521621 [Helianthus annuus]
MLWPTTTTVTRSDEDDDVSRAGDRRRRSRRRSLSPTDKLHGKPSCLREIFISVNRMLYQI